MVDFAPVEAARNEATAQAKSANEFAARGNTLADELRKAVGERFGQSDVAKNVAQARGDFLTAAPKARSDVLGMVQGGTILSPTQQQQIMAEKKSAALVPLMGANMVQQATFGSLEDMLNAGVNAYKAQTQSQQGLAQIAQQNYTSLLNELVTKAQQEQQAQQMAIQQQEAQRAAELFPIQKQKLLKETAQIGARTGTETEKKQAVFEQLKKDAANGMDFNQIISKYSGQIDPQDILVGYNTSSKYGPVQATPEQINKKYGTTIKYETPKEQDLTLKEDYLGKMWVFDPRTGGIKPATVGDSATLNNGGYKIQVIK